MKDTAPKIMVVDDDPGMRITLEGIIEDEGYDVVGAKDGYEAIELARETAFDLIFMDIKMPGIDGVETFRQIKKISPQSVVVTMTGFSVEDLVKQALEEGVYTVLYKPFPMEQIIDIMESVLKTTGVLVVDDVAAHREPLCAILEDSGYNVAEAVDGEEAIAKVKEGHYNLLLMDVMMPGMDGFATFQEIKKIDPGVKVIFITGYAVEDSVREALQGGAYSVLNKPVDPENLLILIKSIIQARDSNELLSTHPGN